MYKLLKSYSKYPGLWKKSLLRMYVWKTPIVHYLSILIQVASFFPAIYLYFASYLSTQFTAFLYLLPCTLSNTFDFTFRNVYSLCLPFNFHNFDQNLVLLLYILKANTFLHEYSQDIHSFPKLFHKEALSTCPRINLIDPVSHQSQIWKISGCLPIFTVNKLARLVGRC